MSSTFSANSGSLERLKVRMRCGCSRCACHKRCTARRLTPTALAMARPVQCVAWPGGSEQLRSKTLATTLAESGARPGLRVLSRSRPYYTLLGVSRLPAPDRRSADARASRHFLHRQAVGRTKDNVRPPHMFERAIAIRDDGPADARDLRPEEAV